MGTTASASLLGNQPPPEKLNDFKNLVTAPEQYAIPELPQKRARTDTSFLMILGASLLFLLVFMSYTLSYADIRRLDNRYDHCGNICGGKNEHVKGVNCSGKDMTEKTYLYIKKNPESPELPENKTCVKSCDDIDFLDPDISCRGPDNVEVESLFNMLWSIIKTCIGYIIAIIVLSVATCFGMLLLLRYYTSYVIWGILIGCYSLLVLLTLLFWLVDDGDGPGAAIIMTIITILVSIFFKIMFKRIPLVISVFKEATKAIFAMPLIIFEPLLTFLSWIIAVVLFLITTTYMITAEILVKKNDYMYDYESSSFTMFTICFNIIMTLWITKFIMGCQTMVISGAVSSWYFSSDKNYLGNPIRTSFSNLVKYHLGSVALGSLIITVVSILKAILNQLSKNRRTKLLIDFCFDWIQKFVVYISKNAYIQIAMHGESFFKSGKRAVRLLYLNLSDVVAVNSIGDFIIFMTKLAVVILSIIFMKQIAPHDKDYSLFIIFITALISGIIAHCVFLVFETTIDTIFLCYCEDCFLNDGMERPYYMSTDLMQFFQESKAVLSSKPTDNISPTAPPVINNDNNTNIVTTTTTTATTIGTNADTEAEDPLYPKW